MPVLAASGLLPLWGCISWSDTVWTGPRMEMLTFDAMTARSVQVRTHNGGVRFTGHSEPMSQATVKVTKRGGGATSRDAMNALEALHVFIESGPDNEWRVGHRWTEPKRPHWQAHVSLHIDGPAKMNLNAETHSGVINVVGAEGEVALRTYNGGIAVGGTGGPLSVETYNGKIEVDYAGTELAVEAYNGPVQVDLTKSAGVQGKIATHNGSVDVVVSDETSAALSCRTSQGRIRVDPPLQHEEIQETSVKGVLGSGGEPLLIQTHNGGIRVRSAAG